MKIYEKVSNRDVDYVIYCLLYKMLEIIGTDRVSYDKQSNTYYTTYYSITITKKRAYATPFEPQSYLIIIKPPKNLTSI